MNRICRTHLTVCLISTMFVGCAGTSSALRNLVSKDDDGIKDPLVLDKSDISSTYADAKKELQSPEATMLKFAKWREDMEDYPEAKKSYRNILADDPNNVAARLGIARVEFKTGQKVEAEDILLATTKKFPKESSAWIEMGRIQSQQQKWDEAVASFQKAVSIDSSDRVSNYELGVALARSDRLIEAERHLSIAGGQSAALYNIGFILYENGRKQEATDWFRRSLASHPDEQTKHSAENMIASLTKSTNDSGIHVASQPRQKSTVDISKSTYQKYRETPGTPEFSTASLSRTGDETARIQAKTQFSGPPTNPIRTTNLQRPAPGYTGNPSTVQQWQGPNASQNSIAPSVPSTSSFSSTVEPQQWKR